LGAIFKLVSSALTYATAYSNLSSLGLCYNYLPATLQEVSFVCENVSPVL